MNRHVTNRQLFFIIFLLLASYSVIELPKVLAGSAGTGAWLPILIGALFFAVAAAIITKLGVVFQEKTLFEYSGLLVGRPFAYVFAIIYGIYFFSILTLLLRSMSETIKADFLIRSPIWSTMLMMLFVAGYAAAKGLTNVGRLAEFFGVFILAAAFVIQGLMFLQGDILNARPLFDGSLTGEYVGAIPLMILPFLGVEMITIIPFSRKNKNKAVWAASLAVLAVGLFYIAVVYTTYMILGVEDTINYQDALIVAIRRIDMEFLQVLKRIDVVFIISWMWAMFCTFAILIFTVSECAKKIIPKANSKFVLIGVCVLVFAGGMLPQNYDEVSKYLTTLVLYFGLVPAFFIPLLLFIVMKVKKYDKKTS